MSETLCLEKMRSVSEGDEHNSLNVRLLQRRILYSASPGDSHRAIMSVAVGDKAANLDFSDGLIIGLFIKIPELLLRSQRIVSPFL